MDRRRPRGARDESLVLDDVTLRAGTGEVFRGTHWTLRTGEQWAILGPNNSGKSLLAAALAGDVVPVRGEVRRIVGGTDAAPHEGAVALLSTHTHRAVVAAGSSFYQSRWHSGLGAGHVTVSHFLSQEMVEEINPFEVNPARSPRVEFLQRKRDAVELLGVSRLFRRKLIFLSNGEMRRVLLARALMQAPRWLVLDEPFAGLDARSRRRLRDAVRRLVRSGMQVVVATNRPDEIPEGTTHLVLVARNRIAAKGPKAAMLRHCLAKQLRKASPSPAATGERSQSKGLPHPRTAGTSGLKLVEMRDVTVRFGRQVILDRLTWTVRSGEYWVLLGPNGSGKTTLLSLLQGDNPQAYAQDIRLFGRSIETTGALWQARRMIGWSSPELHLHYPLEWSCRDVVCSGLFDSIGLHDACTAGQVREARIWLRRLGLARMELASLGDLSVGDQRLVLLARALVKRPRLLVLDEPCQALDRSHRQRVLDAVDRVVKSTGVSLVFVTHHPREVPSCVTHLLKLRLGRVVYEGEWTAGGEIPLQDAPGH